MEKFRKVNTLNPPPNWVEVLVLSPDNELHLTFWRDCGVFACQSKGESTDGWYWKEIDLEKEDE